MRNMEVQSVAICKPVVLAVLIFVSVNFMGLYPSLHHDTRTTHNVLRKSCDQYPQTTHK